MWVTQHRVFVMPRARPLLPLLLALLLCCRRAAAQWSAQPTSGTVTLSAPLTVVDAPLDVPPGATLLIQGNLSACGGPCYVNALGASRILTVGAGASVTLQYVALLNGSSTANGGLVYGDADSSITLIASYVGLGAAAGSGGCVYTEGSLALHATTLQGCQAFTDGGGAHVGGALYIGAQSVVSYNAAYGSGGGVFAAGGAVVDASQFDQNFAGLLGGGLYNLLQPLAITASWFNASFTVGGGGAIYSNGAVSLADSNFTDNDGGAGGGALLLNAPASSFTALRCRFYANYASDVGGALFLRPAYTCADDARMCQFLSNMTVVDCVFDTNYATLGGAGAIFGYCPSALTVRDTLFTGNVAKDKGAGAVYFSGGELLISGCSFDGNEATSSFNSQAGAVAIYGYRPGALTATIENSSFTGNWVFAPDVSGTVLVSAKLDKVAAVLNQVLGRGAGGGLLVNNLNPEATMNVTVRGCSFARNQASRGGGGLSAFSTPGCPVRLAVADCVFEGNAAWQGGAVDVHAPEGGVLASTFSNCSFLGNTATTGGALSLRGVAVTAVTSSALVGNSASFDGGGVAVRDTHALSLTASRVADNRAFGGGFMSLGTRAAAALTALTVRNNSAFAGALYFTADAIALPLCAGCTMADNVATSYGPLGASLPVSFNTTAALISARSGGRLEPPIHVTLFDVFGQTVQEWPDLLVTVAAAPPALGLNGGRAVYYAGGAASLDQLSITDLVGANYSLIYTLNSPQMTALNASVAGASAAVVAVVAPCFPLERFDAREEVKRCVCTAGAVLLNGTCACSYGSYSKRAALDALDQLSCAPCPDGALCLGPHPPLALADYWHQPDNREVFYTCHRRACTAETPAMLGTPNCMPGHEGPLCGLCSVGYTFRGDYCLPCAAKDAYAAWSPTKRGGMAFGAAFAFFVGSVSILLFPLFPEANTRLADMLVLLTPAADGEAAAKERNAHVVARVLSLLGVLTPHLVIAINSLQIVSSFSRTMDVAWPRVLHYLMNGLSLLNLNILRIPSAACATPNVSFFDLFNGITLGVTGLAAYVGALWAAGSLYARAACLPAASVAHFNRVTVSRLLLLLDLVYAPMSQVIVGMFRCNHIGNQWWLASDLSEECYVPRHMRFYRAAIFWALFFSLGVPALYLYLLVHFRVPSVAAALRKQALLQRVLAAAAQRGVLPLGCADADAAACSLSDADVDALYEDLLMSEDASVSSSQASADEEAAAATRLSLVAAEIDCGVSPSPPPPGVPRDAKLAQLLAWAAAQHGERELRGCSWEELRPEQDTRRAGAKEAIGLLHDHFRPRYWYWKLVEVAYRFLLTCVLSFIAPGSAAQVASGLAIALFMQLLYSFLLPHAANAVTRSAYNSHLCILLLFITGLLLKMHVRFTDRDVQFYGVIVGLLVCALFVMPALVAAHASGAPAACMRRLRRLRRAPR